jgi:IrrE N-terminal-like domain
LGRGAPSCQSRCGTGSRQAGRQPLIEQRQTAGHELGHHWFGHSTRVDQDVDLLDVPQRGVATTDEERVVEAFASWFLMPRGAVMSALRLLGLGRPRTALDVYRLSLLLGTCYRTTVRHLPNLRLASQTLARQWFSVPPVRLKAHLDRGAPPPVSREPQVWLVDKRFNDTSIVAHPSDRIVVQLAGDTNWCLSVPPGFTLLTEDDGPSSVGGHPRSQPVLAPPHAEQGRRFVIEVSDVATNAIVDLTAQHDSGDEAATWKLQVQIDGPRLGMV